MRIRAMRRTTWITIALFVAVGCQRGGDIPDPDGGANAGDTGITASDSAGDLRARDAGSCPDGAMRHVPTAAPGRLVATQAQSPITIDGELGERSDPMLEYDDPTGESDNRTVVHARSTSESLYLGVAVTDDQVEADASTGPWENDSFEVAFDPDASGGDTLQGDERKWLVDVDGTVRSGRAEDGTWTQTSEQRAETAVRETDDGYTVEMKLPWSEIGGFEGPDSEAAPNVVLVTNDRDDGTVHRFSWTGPQDELTAPSEWGELEVVGAPCAPDDRGPSDAGPGDGGDSGDSGADGDPRLGPPRYISESDFDFQTELHAVDDLGMDPTGEEAIDDKLEGARASNTLIVFPPGKYKIRAGRDRNPTHYWQDGVEHFGIKGLGDEPKDVQFVVEPQPPEYGGRWINQRGGEGLMLKNFAIQMNWDDKYTSADIALRLSDLLLVEKVEWAGLMPHDDHTNGMLFHPHITDTDGVGELNRVYIREGAIMPDYPDGAGGIRMGPGHKGTMYVTDLWMENNSSSAIRFSKCDGRVGLEGGFFKNNANTNLRGGAGDHPDGPSYMRGATVVLDTEAMNDYQPSDEPLTTTHALRVDSTGQQYSGLIVEDLDIYFLNPPPNSEVINRPSFGDHGAFTIRDVRIQNETSRPTALLGAVPPSNDTGRFENIQVTGSGSGPLKADSGASAEILDSCVESNFDIRNFETVKNVSRSDCSPPTAPVDDPHDH